MTPDTAATDVYAPDVAGQRARAREIGDVCTAAFLPDPGARHIAAAKRAGYERRLRTWFDAIVTLHTASRQPVLTIEDGQRLAGVALFQEPGGAYGLLAQAAWAWRVATGAGLGLVWRTQQNLTAAARYRPREPHYYLPLLAVHPDFHGRGYGGALLDALHARSEAHPVSTGVCLETENPNNVSLYERFGYRVTGTFRAGTDSFAMLRPNGAGGRS